MRCTGDALEMQTLRAKLYKVAKRVFSGQPRARGSNPTASGVSGGRVGCCEPGHFARVCGAYARAAVRRAARRDEELTAVGVGATVGHGEQHRRRVVDDAVTGRPQG